MITKYDKALIERAEKMCWEEIDSECLADKAETEEGRQEIRSISRNKYHHDEYMAGII